MKLEYYAASTQSMRFGKKTKKRTDSTADYYNMMPVQLHVQHNASTSVSLCTYIPMPICPTNPVLFQAEPVIWDGSKLTCYTGKEGLYGQGLIALMGLSSLLYLLPLLNLHAWLSVRPIYSRSRLTNSSRRALPSPAGERSTMTPALSRALILESAPPLPPDTMAPA